MISDAMRRALTTTLDLARTMKQPDSLAWLTSREFVTEAARSLKHRTWRSGILTGNVRQGHCPICERETVFVQAGPWVRDTLRCIRCRSIPRWRAIVHVMELEFPGWQSLSMHESSPGGAASAKFARGCAHYVGSHYFPGVAPGSMERGMRCENLEQQTFADASFDLVVTQDVFEHVLHPEQGFQEIARTLKPGGAHVFTVPWYYWKKATVVRAVEENGVIRHLLPPEYHGNPIDASGALVVTDWGIDFVDIVERCSGLKTTVHQLWDPRIGVEGDFREVFVSRK
jgi:SAM-dependent methyltransferase